MKKQDSRFVCRECGFSSAKWYGRCPECGAWESLVQVKNELHANNRKKPTHINNISSDEFQSLILKDKNLNRVFGNGIVKGSVMLIAGQPGAGKSTLALKLIDQLEAKSVLYVSGEESEKQLKIRSKRVSKNTEYDVLITNCIEDIKANLDGRDIIIVDSIQTMNSEKFPGIQGSPTTVKYVMGELIEDLKEKSIPAIIIGHITKDGTVAGPKTLEHLVDSIFMFDRVNDSDVRILKSTKNRFGSTEEVVLLKMDEAGLHVIENMDAMNLSSNENIGTVMSCTVQGSMPVALQIQALAAVSKYGMPQRVATGIQIRRMQMLVGVVDKYLDIKIGGMDLFVNISSGLTVNDPMLDLPIVSAIISSFKNRCVKNSIAFVGEVGLSGEVYGGRMLETRVRHLEQVGVTELYLPPNNLKSKMKFNIIRNIKEIERTI